MGTGRASGRRLTARMRAVELITTRVRALGLIPIFRTLFGDWGLERTFGRVAWAIASYKTAFLFVFTFFERQYWVCEYIELGASRAELRAQSIIRKAMTCGSGRSAARPSTDCRLTVRDRQRTRNRRRAKSEPLSAGAHFFDLQRLQRTEGPSRRTQVITSTWALNRKHCGLCCTPCPSQCCGSDARPPPHTYHMPNTQLYMSRTSDCVEVAPTSHAQPQA